MNNDEDATKKAETTGQLLPLDLPLDDTHVRVRAPLQTTEYSTVSAYRTSGSTSRVSRCSSMRFLSSLLLQVYKQ